MNNKKQKYIYHRWGHLKELTIDGRKLYYWVDNHPEYVIGTHFYVPDGVAMLRKWSWRKFRYVDAGLVQDYRSLFSIPQEIDKPFYTKEDVRGFIRRGIKRMERPAELKRGEII